MVRNNIGLGLIMLSILSLLLSRHFNLRTIEEPPKPRYLWISNSSLKVTIFFIFFLLLMFIAEHFSFIFFTWNFFLVHVRSMLGLSLLFILIPKYVINENQNLKLYVSVYHWVPAPILPWQLPESFDPKSVKLICVNYPDNE